MDDSSTTLNDRTLEWSINCFTNPSKGVIQFLQELCKLSDAEYAHVRIKSRLENFYTMAESLGPYKNIGWRRRFHLIDDMKLNKLAYRYIDYEYTNDCIRLKEKFSTESEEYSYLNSLAFGFYIPLVCDSIELGYIILSWTKGKPDESKALLIKKYMSSQYLYIPLFYSACRSIITDNVFTDLCQAFKVIQSSPTEALCYNYIANACLKLWGPDSTTYVGKINYKNNCIEVIAVEGRRAKEAQLLESRQIVPIGKGIFSYAINSKNPVISSSLSNDRRFEYYSLISTEEYLGSAISIKLSNSQNEESIAVISVEHELENYFDLDDVRYINGIASVGYHALMAHKEASERIARELDTLFTQMSHDIAEPLQALISDADVLRYQVSILPINIERDLSNKYKEISSRAANIVEGGLQLNRHVRKNLDAGIDGAITRVVDGKINLFRLLNALVDTWEERAASQGVDIKCCFDSLRGIYVQCDEFELKSAVGHLIGNAIKYSFWGHRQNNGENKRFDRYITIVGRIKLDKAIIEFQNYGVGILKSELSRVKEKFFRGVLARKEGRAGTGRGLWSATVFFESIGGGIEVNSENMGSEANSTSPYFTSIKANLPYVLSEEDKNGENPLDG